MEKYYNEEVGSEAILPFEVIDFINQHKIKLRCTQQEYLLTTPTHSSLLDEYEVAMIA